MTPWSEEIMATILVFLQIILLELHGVFILQLEILMPAKELQLTTQEEEKVQVSIRYGCHFLLIS
jgi:hypothetical protein